MDAEQADAAALAALARGEVVAVATDTVFGLVADPGNGAALQRVYDLKRRPEGMEFSLLGGDAGDLEDLVLWPGPARAIAERFWPGPLSLVLPVGRDRLAVPRTGSTLCVRVPDAPALRALLRRSGPLASTSANRHGEPPALTGAEVRAAFGGDVAVVLELGRPGGAASTIIDCSVTPPRVLRSGPIDHRSLETYLQG